MKKMKDSSYTFRSSTKRLHACAITLKLLINKFDGARLTLALDKNVAIA